MSKLGMWIIVVAVVVVAVVAYWHAGQPPVTTQPRAVVSQIPPPTPSGGHEAIDWSKLQEPIGPDEAPVKLTVLVTSGTCFAQPTVDLATRIAKKYPEQVQVRFVDRQSPTGKELAHKYGLTLQNGMAVNGKSHFSFDREQGNKPVALEGPILKADAMAGPMGGYSESDLVRCIETELAKQAQSAGQ